MCSGMNTLKISKIHTIFWRCDGKVNQEMFLQLQYKLNSNFPKKKLLGCEISMVKIGQLSAKLGL